MEILFVLAFLLPLLSGLSAVSALTQHPSFTSTIPSPQVYCLWTLVLRTRNCDNIGHNAANKMVIHLIFFFFLSRAVSTRFQLHNVYSFFVYRCAIGFRYRSSVEDDDEKDRKKMEKYEMNTDFISIAHGESEKRVYSNIPSFQAAFQIGYFP